MVFSPLLQEIIDEAWQKAAHRLILRALETRFGPAPKDVADVVRAATQQSALEALMDLAYSCRDLAAFRAHLGM